MFNCQKITFLLSQQEEKALSPLEKIQVGVHQMMCPRCRAFHQNNRILNEISRKMFK